MTAVAIIIALCTSATIVVSLAVFGVYLLSKSGIDQIKLDDDDHGEEGDISRPRHGLSVGDIMERIWDASPRTHSRGRSGIAGQPCASTSSVHVSACLSVNAGQVATFSVTVRDFSGTELDGKQRDIMLKFVDSRGREPQEPVQYEVTAPGVAPMRLPPTILPLNTPAAAHVIRVLFTTADTWRVSVLVDGVSAGEVSVEVRPGSLSHLSTLLSYDRIVCYTARQSSSGFQKLFRRMRAIYRRMRYGPAPWHSGDIQSLMALPTSYSVILVAKDAYGNRLTNGGSASSITLESIPLMEAPPLSVSIQDRDDGTYVLTASAAAELTVSRTPAHFLLKVSVNGRVLEPELPVSYLPPLLYARVTHIIHRGRYTQRLFLCRNDEWIPVKLTATRQTVTLVQYNHRLSNSIVLLANELSVEAQSNHHLVIHSSFLQSHLRLCCQTSLFRDELVATLLSFKGSNVSQVTQKSFDMRLQNLYAQLGQFKLPYPLTVNRFNCLFDTIEQLETGDGVAPLERWRSKLRVSFSDAFTQAGVDLGGVMFEWTHLFGVQAFGVDAYLFKTDEGVAHVLPPPDEPTDCHRVICKGTVREQHLRLLRSVGRYVGTCIRCQTHIPVQLSRAILLSLRRASPSFYDLEADEPQFFANQVRYLLANSVEELGDTIYFTTTDTRGNLVSLCQGGESIEVTDLNKYDYLTQLAKYRLHTEVHSELYAFTQGVGDIIPLRLLRDFSVTELSTIISGPSTIDVDDLLSHLNIEGTGHHGSQEPVVMWLGAYLRGLPQEQLQRFLLFVTGTVRAPLGGFGSLQPQVTVVVSDSSPQRLPVAHTCFRRLTVPKYANYEALESAMNLALEFGSEGFGLA